MNQPTSMSISNAPQLLQTAHKLAMFARRDGKP
jgi:hypothetical protein